MPSRWLDVRLLPTVLIPMQYKEIMLLGLDVQLLNYETWDFVIAWIAATEDIQ